MGRLAQEETHASLNKPENSQPSNKFLNNESKMVFSDGGMGCAFGARRTQYNYYCLDLTTRRGREIIGGFIARLKKGVFKIQCIHLYIISNRK